MCFFVFHSLSFELPWPLSRACRDSCNGDSDFHAVECIDSWCYVLGGWGFDFFIAIGTWLCFEVVPLNHEITLEAVEDVMR